jgi:hypothetical protein
LTVAWQRNGVTVPGGLLTANTNVVSTSFTLTNLVPDHAGVYTVVVTNSVGSVTSAPVAIDVTTLFNSDVLTNIWSLEPNSVPFLGTANSERGLAFNPASVVFPNGSLLVPRYVSVSSRSLIVVDAATGAAYSPTMALTDLATFDMTNGARGLNMVGATADGVIYVGNLTTSATNVGYYLYRYPSDDYNSALPLIAYSGDPGGPMYAGLRWGETLAVRGTGTGTEVLIAPSGGMNLTNFYNWETNIVALLRTTDGTNFTPTVIRVTNAPSSFATVGLAFGAGNTFFAKQHNAPLRFVEYDAASGIGWVKQSYDLNAVPGCVSGIAVNGNVTKLGAVSVETPDNFRYYDITDLTRDPGLLDQEPFLLNYPNVTAGGVGAVAFGTNGTIYVLDSGNGIKVFAPNSYTPPATFSITGIVPDVQGAKVSFPAQSGRLYQVQSRGSLTEGGWARVGLPMVGSGSNASVTNLFLGQPVTNRFYRAVSQ